MAENTYYIPQTGEDNNLREGLNGSDLGGHLESGNTNIGNGFVNKIREIQDIDKADKYVIRHKFGEHFREGEDIDETNLPS